MVQVQPTKKSSAGTSLSDMISNLPGNVMDKILSSMPLRDAVRTSILSRQWRFYWAKISELVFDDTLLQGSVGRALSNSDKIMVIINQVLLLHQGPILKFTLSVSGLESCSEIDQLMLFLSRNGVEELTLRIKRGKDYWLPSSFFSCLHLKHLSLDCCVFEPPSSFKGFSRLISLELTEVSFSSCMFSNMVSSFPLLERLTLNSCHLIFLLDIDAPMLKSLCINSCSVFLSFKTTPLLTFLSITSKFSLSCIGRRKPLLNLNQLKILDLRQICFGNKDMVSTVLCLIKSSPNLEKVTIEVSSSTNPKVEPVLELIGEKHHSNFSLNRLREVRMRLVPGARPELEFIKLLLAKSHVLEKLLIEPSYSGKDAQAYDHLGMLKELTSFERASPKAKIVYEYSPGNQV